MISALNITKRVRLSQISGYFESATTVVLRRYETKRFRLLLYIYTHIHI